MESESIESRVETTEDLQENSGNEQSTLSYESKLENTILEKNIIYDINSNSDDSDKEDTNKGAAAIIYNKETGEFYFELKPSNYPIKEARGKLALVGGKVDTTDASSLDALIREIREEVVDKRAQEILISKLTQLGTHYYTIVEIIDGRRVETDVYRIEVNINNWKTVKNSALTEGLKQVLNYYESDHWLNDFAFGYEEPLKKLIDEEFTKRSKSNKSEVLSLPIMNSSKFYQINY